MSGFEDQRFVIFICCRGLTVVCLFVGSERGDPVVLRSCGLFDPRDTLSSVGRLSQERNERTEDENSVTKELQ